MPERSDLVRVQLESRQEPFALPWDSGEKLLREIRYLESRRPIVAEFEDAGSSRPVRLTRGQKTDLIELIEAWADRVTIAHLPDAVWDLRGALVDDLHAG